MPLNNNGAKDPNAFRFRVRKAPGNPYQSVEAFKASPAFTTIQNAVAGKPDTVGTVYVSYKLYEGSVWVRYDWEDETKRLVFRDYIVAGGFDFGDFEQGKQLFRNQNNPDGFPTYGFLA